MTNIRLPYNYVPRGYQRPSWEFMENGGKRSVKVWHRRAGKDLDSLHQLATAAFQRVGTYWHVLPEYKQGKRIVWNGMTHDGRPFLDAFPSDLVLKKLEQDMAVHFVNGSVYQVVGADNTDALVGANPVGVIFSEWSLMDPKAWQLINPILAANDGWASFIYTPRGRNHGYTLLKQAEKDPNWFTEVLTVDDTMPETITPEALEQAKADMSESMFLQEFYCSFDASIEGAYYSYEMNRAVEEGRITEVPWEEDHPVDTYWDLGMDDATTIWFVQCISGEYRFIDYYEADGEGLPHYVQYLQKKPYTYGEHWAPHDIKVRELGTGKSRLEVAYNMGLRFNVAPRLDIQDGIDACRRVLPRCYFDKEKCDRGVEALKTYRKEKDEKRGVFRKKPVHDWSSHAADGFRVFGMCHRQSKRSPLRQPYAVISNNPLETGPVYESDYDMFA